jgi:hypothetical protein
LAHMRKCSDFHAESLHVDPEHMIRIGMDKIRNTDTGPSIGYALRTTGGGVQVPSRAACSGQ